MSTIQRQSILSSIIIFAGFGFGALNLLVLQPQILTTEQWGLTRVITEASMLLASFTPLGANSVVAKFMPFYKRHLPRHQNDLPFITLSIWSVGLLITLMALVTFQPQIVTVFGRNNPLFQQFYYGLLLFVMFQATFIMMEMFAWYAGKVILSNLLKELLFRLLTTFCLLAMFFKLVDFTGFMTLFACAYLPASATLIIAVARAGGLPWVPKISKVTRRLKSKMISLGSFVFLTGISNIAFVVCDTLFLASMYSLSQAGIYAVAQYFSQVLEVPMRSMNSSSIPTVAEYWRQKNYAGLQSIYRKSSLHLLIAGMAIGGLILVNTGNIVRFLPPAYQVMAAPMALLIVARWINLGTGLNTTIIGLSTMWRFDFATTLIYSLIGIPLNYLLIRQLGMMGAALATIIAMMVYNGVRFYFLYRKYRLQPFTRNTAWVFLTALACMVLAYIIPTLPNLYLDTALRSAVFIGTYGWVIIRGGYSQEVNLLWHKYWNAALNILKYTKN